MSLSSEASCQPFLGFSSHLLLYSKVSLLSNMWLLTFVFKRGIHGVSIELSCHFEDLIPHPYVSSDVVNQKGVAKAKATKRWPSPSSVPHEDEN